MVQGDASGSDEPLAYPRWLAEAIQLAPVGVFVTDAHGEQLFANRRWCELTGIDNQSGRGRGWLAAIHPEQRHRVASFWFEHVLANTTIDGDFRITLVDGTIRWTHCFAVPIFRPDGGLVGYVGILADTTERREMERAYRTLVEHSLQGFVVYQDSSPVFANPAFTEITGYTLEEILASRYRHSLGTIHPDDRQRVMTHTVRFLSDEPVSPRLETRFFRKDGAERWLELFMSRIEYHRRPALQVVYVDVTERHQMQRGLQSLNAELERRVHERTAQLEGALRELETFSYSVSHDLRAPLRAIDGFSQALLEDYAPLLDERGRHYLNRVRRATRHMGDLIDDLLGLARVMRSELVRETVDLSAVARDVIDELHRAAPQRAPTVDIEPGVRGGGDRVLLRTVLTNLIGNAWKFTGTRAAPRIEFGAVPETQPQAYFVRDNGVGFDMSYADKLFGAFSRLHSPDEFEGTGIGLATVHRIIARHGGRVWAESAPEQGATFYFTLGD